MRSSAGTYTVAYSGGNAISGGSSVPYSSTYSGYGGSGSGPGLAATASATGTITATFTWSPSYSGEPTPESVIIYESGSAGYYHYGYSSGTFSADDGFGDAPVNSNNGSTQSTGFRWSINNSPGQSFTVTCTPSATSSMNYGYVSASVIYSASVVVPQVGVGGSTVYNNANNIIIGQGCAPSVGALNGMTFDNYQWAVTGDLFTAYNASVNSASVTYPTATTWTVLTPHYYYKKESASVDSIRAYVDAHVTINNVDTNIGRICVKNSVQARTPQSYFHAVPGRISYGYYYGNGQLGVVTGDANTDGIRWNGLIQADPIVFPFTITQRGVWEIVQILSPSITMTNNGSNFKLVKDGQSGLDTQYPYANANPSTVYTPFLDDGVQYHSNDSPFFGLGPLITSLTLSEYFKTFMLYKPVDIGFGSEFVPLQEIDWDWSANTPFSGPPTIDLGPVHATELVQHNHPTWSFAWNFANLHWVSF